MLLLKSVHQIDGRPSLVRKVDNDIHTLRDAQIDAMSQHRVRLKVTVAANDDERMIQLGCWLPQFGIVLCAPERYAGRTLRVQEYLVEP